MFKKLLTVGVLATALIGGIGTASAVTCNSEEPGYIGGGKYYRYLTNPYNNFANVFTEDTRFGKMTWYFKDRLGSCELSSGYTAYQAYYEGRLG
ncbi:hypothetical protein LGZ99_12515 [Photorhabdus temperata]|uniref:Antimicrobial protein n=1 Tax=Photorhabdus temperata subsp. temperata Meg1 TaxID=1393735 RepID=A0A081RVA6_PHOTE|nr:hypothetical protein [Photorhabdus temperata]KER02609.1 hypothetical protein MEG1DRAFT_02753 [Photorhabdus temperata subsp. temperata Meg1]MCT8348003.1 hypothetical protein [Photorhabdus temperata]